MHDTRHRTNYLKLIFRFDGHLIKHEEMKFLAIECGYLYDHHLHTLANKFSFITNFVHTLYRIYSMRNKQRAFIY
jgi:hypothetical protein